MTTEMSHHRIPRTQPVHWLPLATLALALLLAGCAGTRPAYETPAAVLPAAWQQLAQPAQPVQPVQLLERWWRQFGDPALAQLVETALARNNDLAAAAWRVRQAQLQAGIAATALAPTLSGSVSSNASRRLEGSGSATARSSGATLAASYEVDLWGRVARTRDAAEWSARASAEDLEATAQALAGTAAGLYWQLGYLQLRLASSQESLAYSLRTQQLVRAQYAAGAVSALELREAEQTVAGQRALGQALRGLRQQPRERRIARRRIEQHGTARCPATVCSASRSSSADTAPAAYCARPRRGCAAFLPAATPRARATTPRSRSPASSAPPARRC